MTHFAVMTITSVWGKEESNHTVTFEGELSVDSTRAEEIYDAVRNRAIKAWCRKYSEIAYTGFVVKFYHHEPAE